jgi:hypothetical protein
MIASYINYSKFVSVCMDACFFFLPESCIWPHQDSKPVLLNAAEAFGGGNGGIVPAHS